MWKGSMKPKMEEFLIDKKVKILLGNFSNIVVATYDNRVYECNILYDQCKIEEVEVIRNKIGKKGENISQVEKVKEMVPKKLWKEIEFFRGIGINFLIFLPILFFLIFLIFLILFLIFFIFILYLITNYSYLFLFIFTSF